MKVLITGAGVSGLAALKECLAKGFLATVFEAESRCGGQWRYTEPNSKTGHVHSSMYRGCILNSCRDTSAYSDFPLDPRRYPQYFGHAAYLKYLEEYATFFNLNQHIQFNTKVLECEQTIDGGWKVSYEQDGEVRTDIYDALFSCTGHLSNPRTPDFEGLSDFRGEYLHSHFYRTPGPFEGKRVAVIGIGSSAVDIACEVGPQSEACHLITRTGGWIIPRFVFGKPVEAMDSRLMTYLSSTLSQEIQGAFLNFVEGKPHPEIKPKHRLLEASPTVRGDFLEKVNVGTVIPHRASIKRFTENGLILTNGTELEVDTVISCTGYHIDYPYLPLDSYRDADNETIDRSNSINLYQLIVSPNYRNLFFIGLPEAPGPGGPVYESQARWSVAVLSGAITLPQPEEMKRWIQIFSATQARKFVHSPRHTTLMESNVSYMDQLTKPLNANPSFSRLIRATLTSNPLRAFSTLNSVYLGITSSCQFRLFGDGACPELAVATIARISSGKKELSKGEQLALQKLKAELDSMVDDV